MNVEASPEIAARVSALSDAIASLNDILRDLPDLRLEIDRLCGLIGRLAVEILERDRIPVSLRRHETVQIPDTLKTLTQVAALRRSGVFVPLEGLTPLLLERSSALASDLLGVTEMSMIRLEPNLKFDRRDLSIDGDAALREFARRTGKSLLDRPEGGGPHVTPFLDFALKDLPAQRLSEMAAFICANPTLRAYTADEIVTVSGMIDVVRRIKAGYDILFRRQPLISKTLRSMLWTAPRLGLLICLHPKTTRLNVQFQGSLSHLIRADRFLREISLISDQDDDVTEAHLSVIGARSSAFQARVLALDLLQAVAPGRSAWRFPSEVFDVMPGQSEDLSGAFLSHANPVRRAASDLQIGSSEDADFLSQTLVAPRNDKPSGWLKKILSRIEMAPKA